jgi:hypothetical protein
MRRVIALVAALTAAATSQVAIASVFAQGEAVVVVAGGEDEPAREWDVDVTGGMPSTDHITLAPVAVGFQGEVTVEVAGSAATVRLTTTLPADRDLASVGCLDDLTPPTEINPAFDRLSFTLDVVPGRAYRCFVASLPSGVRAPTVAPAPAVQPRTGKPLPRSDAAMTSPLLPGWPAVVLTLVVIAGAAVVLRPARR